MGLLLGQQRSDRGRIPQYRLGDIEERAAILEFNNGMSRAEADHQTIAELYDDLLADPDQEARWIAFHASRAIYQVLCRSCNSAKGRKVAAQ